MATPKLQTTVEQRVAEVQFVGMPLPDGRRVVIGKRGFHVTSSERCDCGENRFKKNVCKHMLKVLEQN